MSNGIKKPQATGIRRVINATGYSFKGLIAAWQCEAAFRQELVLTIVLSATALFLPVSNAEKLALIASLLLVLIVELINSAIEAVVDRIGSEQHELSGRAKDLGSAAVFVSLCLTIITWVTILFL